MKTIFIQIAAYRDPQLPLTVEDCLAKAKHPERLTFAICHQFGEDEGLSAFQGEQFKYISVPYQVSMGACWARYSTNTLYSGEDYTLQIDSHMRFVQDWDEKMIDMLESLPEKSFLTAYVPAYNAATEEKLDATWEMTLNQNLPLDIPCFIPSYFTADEPKQTFFFSGHFFFCRGELINLVPYDRLLYFHGEEVTMAMRLYTHGYNGYHPHTPLIWHEYTREGRTKQWDDDKDWWRLDMRSKDRARQILKGELHEQLGGVRTAGEYMKEIGLAPKE